MPDRRRARCTRCGARRDEGASISWEGLCTPCAIDAVSENVSGLMEHKGSAFDRWRRGMAACVGADLPGQRDGLRLALDREGV